jgi:hypothetical protein
MPDMTKKPLQGLRRWVAEQIIQDVPEDIALCNMDCKKEQCTHEEWEHCDRRIHKAAGEFMPGDAGQAK